MTILVRLRRCDCGFAVLFAVALLCGFFLSPCGFAQTETASIFGRVTDQSGGVIPNVEIELKNVDTGISQTTKTNSEGFYVFPSLKPGRYLMNVRKQAFQTVSVTGITLDVQDNVSRNFVLQVGSSAESITVKADQNNINTTDGSVSTVVDRQFVENMPLNGRTLQSLITLTPGVVLTPASNLNQGQFSVNGQRSDANYFVIDGVSANAGTSAGTPGQSAGGALPALSASGGTNTLVSIDAIEEFRIQTSSFSPEFGRTPGAQVSIITRSGTKEFHGTLFNYFRNEVMDANDWFSDSLGFKKAPLRQNDFGGVFGGPLIRNRTFFFVSYEGLRLRLPQTRTDLVPSLSARQQAAQAIQPLLNLYPVPNGPTNPTTLFAPFSSNYSDPSALDAGSIRLDHTINTRLSVFGRYNYAPSNTSQRSNGSSGPANVVAAVQFRNQTLTLGATANISSTIVADMHFNYSRSKADGGANVDTFGGGAPLSNSQLFPSISAPSGSSLALILLGGTTIVDGSASSNIQRQVNAVGNVSVQKGTHLLKFGVDYRHLSPTFAPSPYSQTLLFLGLTGPRGALSADALLAVVTAFDGITLTYHNVSTYAQDTWRATPRMTLTYGLRWDVNPAPSGQNGKTLLAVQGLNNPSTVSFAPSGSPLYNTAYANFAPRVGFAYQLVQGSSRALVLRSGFGLFYDLGAGDVANASTNFPFRRANVLSSPSGIPYPLTSAQASPPPFSLTPSSGSQQIQVVDPNLSTPRTYQWNAALEQSLGPNQAVSVSYIGAVGRRLLRFESVGRAGAFASLLVTKNTATSDYHALQVQFKRRFSKGLEALGSYTWSHSFDIASTDSLLELPSNSFPPGTDRGSSDFDVRHAFTGAVTYSIPAAPVRAIRHILRDWSVDTIFTARSATPVDITDHKLFINGTGQSPRPDLTPGIALYLYGSQYPGGKIFNNTPGAVAGGCPGGSQSVGPFCPPPLDAMGNPLRQGNLGRNALRGFGSAQIDLGLRREIRLTERFKLQFRAEEFNILNHPNFGNPIGDISDPRFGRSVSMLGRSLGSGQFGGLNPLYQIGGPRSTQLALKFLF